MKKALYNIKRFFWLIMVFIVRIVFSKRNMKTNIFKALYYNFNGGFNSDQVTLYNLNKKNKKDYISEFEWYKSRKINYPNDYMLNNKLIFNDLIKDYINIPKTYITKKNGIITSDKQITIKDAIDIIKTNKSVYFKPISKGKGTGVKRIDFKDNLFYIDFNKKDYKDIESILLKEDNYFISECITEAKYLRDIYDKTSNTIRIITARYEDEARVLYAVQRIGTKETIPVDNGSRGGLVSNIDLKTGVLSEARSIHNTNIYLNHPDSKAKIKGVKIPKFKEVKDKILNIAKDLKEFKFIAWDILITDDDIYVIEANASSGVNIIQVFGGQRNKELGDFYKKMKIIK